MKKIILAVFGTVLILIGAADPILTGLLLSHDKWLIGIGIVFLIPIILNGTSSLLEWRWLRKQARLALVFTASPLEQAFDPSKPWPVRPIDIGAPTGPDIWTLILLTVAIVAIAAYLMPWLSRRHRR